MKRDSITFEEAIEIEKKIGEMYWKDPEQSFFRTSLYDDKGIFHCFVGVRTNAILDYEDGFIRLVDVTFHYKRAED